jgi:hypothetical protein
MRKIISIALIAFSLNAFAQGFSDLVINNGLSGRNVASLTVNPSAQPDNVCSGQAVHLFSVPDGGTTNYSYAWTSDPPGFVSDAAEPVVRPKVSTVYTVEVSDGTNITSGSVSVIVKPLPVIDLVPADSGIQIISQNEISTCVFNSITLDAGNPGSNYLWNTGSHDQKLFIQTSGISFDVQDYTVTVTNPLTGCSEDSEIRVNFTFSNCTYGVEEQQRSNLVIYPNPASNGIFTVLFEGGNKELNLEVYSPQGILVHQKLIERANGTSCKSIIDLSDQPTGVYVIKGMNSEINSTQKLIITK